MPGWLKSTVSVVDSPGIRTADVRPLTAKSCGSDWPVFVIANVTVPTGALSCERSNAHSLTPTFTVVVGAAPSRTPAVEKAAKAVAAAPSATATVMTSLRVIPSLAHRVETRAEAVSESDRVALREEVHEEQGRLRAEHVTVQRSH